RLAGRGVEGGRRSRTPPLGVLRRDNSERPSIQGRCEDRSRRTRPRDPRARRLPRISSRFLPLHRAREEAEVEVSARAGVRLSVRRERLAVDAVPTYQVRVRRTSRLRRTSLTAKLRAVFWIATLIHGLICAKQTVVDGGKRPVITEGLHQIPKEDSRTLADA